MRKIPWIIIPLLLLTITPISGCSGAEGNLGDFLGWHSLGGRWEGTLQLSDGRELPMALTFTEFDGDFFHALVEAGVGDEYINNQADGEYFEADRSFQIGLPIFFTGPCNVMGHIASKYSISGSMEVAIDPTPLTGSYQVTFVP